ncbi:MAG: hypothetical protein QOJ02_3864 [Acidobacteriota bacterium]|jgi:DUF4097 and DUF4098 domain-containing protein YvlB|nr:hypothetical protein [Acidobacteriota bacterium]
MKLNSSIITVLLAALFVCGASAQAQKTEGKGTGRGEGTGQGAGRGESAAKRGGQAVVNTTVTESVNVTLALGAGKISVRGWDKSELRAQAKGADSKIELRKVGGAEASNPAARVEILVYDKSTKDESEDESCNANSDVTLDVPRGATVYLKTQDGDVDVEDVTEAHIETAGGRIELRRISKATDATSVGGDVSLEDASGRARLNSIGGVIGIRDFRPLDASDFLKVRSVSGDILLDRVGSARVEANTISGVLKMMGSLVRGGIYSFTTTIGDITLVLPADSSFKLTAKVSEGGEIITEFPLKYKGAVSPISLLQAGRLVGTYGSGDATVNMVSFSGTLRLRKK